MGRLTAIVVGALFALMAGALGVVATLLVVVLVKDYLPQPPQASAVNDVAAIQPARISAEPTFANHSLSSLEVQPASFSPTLQLLPMTVGSSEPAGISWDIVAPSNPSVTPTLHYTIANAPDGAKFAITATLADATAGIPKEELSYSVPPTPTRQGDIPVSRPGKYTVTISAVDNSPISPSSKTVIVPNMPSEQVTVEYKELGFGQSTKHVVPQAWLKEQVFLPDERFKLTIKATGEIGRRLALRAGNLSDGSIQELGVAPLSVSGNNLAFPPSNDPKSTPLTADREWQLGPGRYKLFIYDISATEQLSGSVTVFVADSSVRRPEILALSNNQEADVQPLSDPVPNVYHQFLKLSGRGRNQTPPPLRDILFPIYVNRPSKTEVPRFEFVGYGQPTFAQGPDESWSAVLRLPKLEQAVTVATDKSNARLYAVAQESGRHVFADAALLLNIQPSGSAPVIAKLQSIDDGSQSPTDALKTFRTRKTTVKITGVVSPTPATLSDYRLVVLDAASKVVGVGARGTDKSSEFSIEEAKLAEGENQLRLAMVLGDQRGQVSAPFNIHVRTSGPRVTGVTPPNFGTAPGIQKLSVQFSRDNPLVEVNAEDEHNYILLGSSGGAFNSGREKKYRPSTATFDAVTNTVALQFASLPADLYQLRINARAKGADPLFTHQINADGTLGETDPKVKEASLGILDEFGNALASSDGKPETDYVLEMSRSVAPDGEAQLGLTGRMADVGGIPESKGPQVDYPEYTEPRKYPDGFNPSDKVVTRVARLYYYRDAPRVAQIVNRRTQSYNRANVSMARQLADQARIFANGTVDERRKAERSAAQSASKAREAENSLATLQQALTAARNDLQRTQSAVSQKQESIARQNESLQALQQQESTAKPEELKEIRGKRAAAEQELSASNRELARLQEQVTSAQTQVTLNEQRINAILGTIEALRSQEIADREAMETNQAKEDRAIDQQFRLEVAAAKEDPDTYAPGILKSDDPVAQVSLSVIGEGLIQLRGPLKGVNIVRTMINEIDVPVGQVRIGVHTVQVNGEDGNKMEHVASRIQRYVDHSRFLTSQSAQMLRNAVVAVASEKAMMAASLCPEGTQELRDLKYQEAFFGKDFMDELREMDSEFLHTGNKLLALHSMDSTSLASALFLLGLASNDTRQQILCVFEANLKEKLRKDERKYFKASDTSRFNGLTPPFQFLGDNAKFVSFRGYFDNTVVGDETLNPVQREFIRLAQIFKSRLITEIELKQRVVERALIEERIGDYQKQLKLAVQREQTKERELETQREALRKEQANVLRAIQLLRARASAFAEFVTNHDRIYRGIADPSAAIAAKLKKDNATLKTSLPPAQLRAFESLASSELKAMVGDLHNAIAEGRVDDAREIVLRMQEATDVVLGQVNPRLRPDREPDEGDFVLKTPFGQEFTLVVKRKPSTAEKSVVEGENGSKDAFVGYLKVVWSNSESFLLQLQQIQTSTEFDQEVARLLAEVAKLRATDVSEIKKDPFKYYVESIHLEKLTALRLDDATHIFGEVVAELDRIQQLLTAKALNVNDAHVKWVVLRTKLDSMGRSGSSLRADLGELITSLDQAFENILAVGLQAQFAQEQAEAARRPLDHKKFLDMLIDETEEKFIELVEGTRSHTAVIDDYVKRLATALDDDFNTQFYEPAFRQIRQQTYLQCSVDFGQIEHTTVLTNNRAFAKVLPQATMEFDLPKRQIVIAEALNAAQAAYSDYGALMTDPNFLALTKLFSGQPTAPVFNDSGVAPLVRDVLPGLPSQTDESLLVQSPTGQPQFASQLEALIPDPAVYKFETGTGFEIRPVIQPDGQSVVFNFNYMYTTNIREPVRADEKHLGRVKRHFINTDVQIGNYELREVSRYRVALKAQRTGRGVPLLEDVPVAGILFRPLPQGESSLQQNVILAQSVIFPTLFDLMGLRWAPAVADLDACQLQEQEFVYRSRMKTLKNRVYDYSSEQVDQFLRVPEGERRRDLYRTQEEIPLVHPNGYLGPGLDRQDSPLIEGAIPGASPVAPPAAAPVYESLPAPLLPALPAAPPAGADAGAGSSRDGIVPASAVTIGTARTGSSVPRKVPLTLTEDQPQRLPGTEATIPLRSQPVPPPSRPLPRATQTPSSPPMSSTELRSPSHARNRDVSVDSSVHANFSDRSTVTITPAVVKKAHGDAEIRVTGATVDEGLGLPETLRKDEGGTKKASPQGDGNSPRPPRRWLPNGWPLN